MLVKLELKMMVSLPLMKAILVLVLLTRTPLKMMQLLMHFPLYKLSCQSLIFFLEASVATKVFAVRENNDSEDVTSEATIESEDPSIVSVTDEKKITGN